MSLGMNLDTILDLAMVGERTLFKVLFLDTILFLETLQGYEELNNIRDTKNFKRNIYVRNAI